MFMIVTMESAVFMGKNYLVNCHSITNTKDLTMKQMFDLSAKLVSEQDEIHGVKTIDWEDSWSKYLSLIGDEQVISLQRTKVYVFSDSVLCLGEIHESSQSNDAWEERLFWFKTSQEYRNFYIIDGEPMEFEWNMFPGYNTLQLSEEVKSLHQRISKEGLSSCRCSTTCHGDLKAMKKNSFQMLNSFLYIQRFGTGHWSFLGPGSEKKWYSVSADSPQGEWDKMADDVGIRRKQTSSLPCYESIVQRNAQKQRRWKIVDTLLCQKGNN